ncbi:MAG TPA: bifunctional UDP-sugar hydrolase/5'-nucleotidase [Polyangiaceae bacterium]|nr:bifunctional UDP-sugar hydrolase/5'-nucleotidase [Polyangiaceae bacterium]
MRAASPRIGVRWGGWLALAVGAGCQGNPQTTRTLAPAPTHVASSTDGAAPRVTNQPGEFVLSVMSLNDLHGKLGALPWFAGYVRAVAARRVQDGAVIVVDAGDMFQGTLGSNATQGSAVVEAYNALPLTAAALGNHEFDYGYLSSAGATAPLLGADPQGALRARIAEAQFKVLSANLVSQATGRLPEFKNLAADALIEVRGVQVGLVGILTEETPRIVRRDYFAGLAVKQAAPSVIERARKLRERGAEVVLVLAHAGGDCSRFDQACDLSSCDAESGEIFRLARALPPGLVDGIVAGHTHAGVAHVENGIPIVEAYSRGKAFARLDIRLTVRAGRPNPDGTPAKPVRHVSEAHPFPPEPLCPDSAELAPCSGHLYEGQMIEPDPELERVIGPALERAKAARAQWLGVELTSAAAGEHGRESALGNLFVDALREAHPEFDVAIINGGSLRADLPAGPLSYGTLYEAMPFDNGLVQLTLTGAELRRLFTQHLSHDQHGIVSISGLRLGASCAAHGLVIELKRESGSRVRDTESLRILTSDYLATGGDQLLTPLALSEGRIQPLGNELMRDALARGLARRPRRDPQSVRVIDPKHPRLQLPSPRPVRCSGSAGP